MMRNTMRFFFRKIRSMSVTRSVQNYQQGVHLGDRMREQRGKEEARLPFLPHVFIGRCLPGERVLHANGH